MRTGEIGAGIPRTRHLEAVDDAAADQVLAAGAGGGVLLHEPGGVCPIDPRALEELVAVECRVERLVELEHGKMRLHDAAAELTVRGEPAVDLAHRPRDVVRWRLRDPEMPGPRERIPLNEEIA